MPRSGSTLVSRFHQTRRAVRTASVAQVRQPIFRSSMERWRRYGKHLGPLTDALGAKISVGGWSLTDIRRRVFVVISTNDCSREKCNQTSLSCARKPK